LPRLLFDYIDGGALHEDALGRNEADLKAVRLRQRVLTGIDRVDLSAVILGQNCSMPLVMAPVGLTGMFARRGEVQAARAARAAGVPFCQSTLSICGLREVADAAAPQWFQLYMLRDRGLMKTLLERAWGLGCPVLMFTVDTPVPGERLREQRLGMTAAPTALGKTARALDGLAHPGWLLDVYLRGRPHHFGNVAEALEQPVAISSFWAWLKDALEAGLGLEHVEWLRANWPGKLVIKGVLDPEDARAVVAAGADGVVVSNHGGRQLDAAPSSISALPGIADAVGDRTCVLMDGGVRSGEDVVRALALGAQGCLIGRAWVWALAAHGQAGVEALLGILRHQMATTMMLAGCADVGRIGRDALA
jgi:L-lactate dehydrogenase (cytochrome)